MNFEDYDLIGMGEFAHGIEESRGFDSRSLNELLNYPTNT
jgi:hypothetical protein